MVDRPVPEVAPGPGAPRVHVDVAPGSAPGVELRERLGYETIPVVVLLNEGTATGFRSVAVGRSVCAVPCERVVDGRADHEFYFGGPGLGESGRFKLARENGDVFLTVHARSRGFYIAGVVLAVVGAGAMGLGTVAVALTAANGGYRGGPDGGGSPVPFGMLGAGSALLGVGITLIFAGRTTFTRSAGPPAVALSW
jgi:hypothetical protein